MTLKLTLNHWDNYFKNRFGFYPHLGSEKEGIRHSYFKEFIKNIIAEEETKTEEEAYQQVVEDVIIFDYIEYCKQNNLIP